MTGLCPGRSPLHSTKLVSVGVSTASQNMCMVPGMCKLCFQTFAASVLNETEYIPDTQAHRCSFCCLLHCSFPKHPVIRKFEFTCYRVAEVLMKQSRPLVKFIVHATMNPPPSLLQTATLFHKSCKYDGYGRNLWKQVEWFKRFP